MCINTSTFLIFICFRYTFSSTFKFMHKTHQFFLRETPKWWNKFVTWCTLSVHINQHLNLFEILVYELDLNTVYQRWLEVSHGSGDLKSSGLIVYGTNLFLYEFKIWRIPKESVVIVPRFQYNEKLVFYWGATQKISASSLRNTYFVWWHVHIIFCAINSPSNEDTCFPITKLFSFFFTKIPPPPSTVFFFAMPTTLFASLLEFLHFWPQNLLKFCNNIWHCI